MKKSVELYTCLWGLLLCAGALLVNDWALEALFCCPDGMPDHFRLNFRVYAATMAASRAIRRCKVMIQAAIFAVLLS